MPRLHILLPLLTYLATRVTAAIENTPYCGSGPAPTISDCQDAINMINTSGNYKSGDEINSGDCQISVQISALDTEELSGSTLQSAAQAIVNSCAGNGWEWDNQQNNITVSQCTVCEYGTCEVCNAPAAKAMMVRKSRGARPLILPKVERPRASKRQSNCPTPPNLPTVQCCSNFSAKTADCIDLGNRLKGQTLTTPYTAAEGECELAIEASSPNFQVQGDDVGQRIIDDANDCNTDGAVGQVIDTGADGYTFYFGQLCNQFGFGDTGCDA